MNSQFALTLLVLMAFAANSILCRLALAGELIDPASFTLVRLISAALTLYILVLIRTGTKPVGVLESGSWFSAIALFIYAGGFSVAYQWLDAGTGALILFASVQFSMVALNLIAGQTFKPLEWFGMAIALAGFVYLVLPGVTAPPALGAALMSIAGIAWGVYSIKGKGSKNATHDTMANFIRTLPLAVCLLPFVSLTQLDMAGLLYAIASGAIASGLGYALWYKVLPSLEPSIAAVSQLSVPVIATLGGVILLGETLDYRLTLSSLVILGGIGLVIHSQRK